MASTVKLLPCPMCGGEFSIFYGHNAREAFAWCSCACGIVTRNQHAATDRDAARMVADILNRRAGGSDAR